MELFIYGLIGLYALLTGIAGFQQWKERGYQARALLFIVVSIAIVITLFIPSKDVLFLLLILEFVLLHVLAVAEGLLTNATLRYSHHITRFIFHCILLLMVYKFMK